MLTEFTAIELDALRAGRTITPVELAKELGHLPEARPGLKVRNYLRTKYPDHEKGMAWFLTPTQADAVRAYFNTRQDG